MWTIVQEVAIEHERYACMENQLAILLIMNALLIAVVGFLIKNELADIKGRIRRIEDLFIEGEIWKDRNLHH